MMEKFDGVRVFWDGKSLKATSGNELIQVPNNVKFPSIPFDGELWFVSSILF
jgi:hypothetical protein